MNVLVIEDDNRIARLVERALTEDGHSVAVSHNDRERTRMLLSGKFDAALLDILLPEMDGFEVLEQVRAKRCKTPILVLTAVDAVPKISQAFDLGADDYLVKPFILEILLARVGAIARRVALTGLPPASAGGVTLDRNRRVAMRFGKEIALTRKQLELLETLIRRPGLITTREQLIEAGWGTTADVKENTLDVYIHGLRSKLEDKSDNGQPLIKTVHGSATCLWRCRVHALSVRAKLMLPYLLVTLAGLLIFGLMSFGALQYALLQGKKTHLQGREDRFISLLNENRAKGVTVPLSEHLRNYALVTHEGNPFHIHNLDGSLFFPLEGISRDSALPLSDDCTQPVFSSVSFDRQFVLVMCHMILLDGRMVRLHIGDSLEEEAYVLRTYRNALFLLMPGLLILSSVSGYFSQQARIEAC